MKKCMILIFVLMFLSFTYLISGQNGTNTTNNGELNLTGFCGDGIIQVELDEECDDGNANTDTPCQVAYGEECSYCDTNCQSQIISGGYCGDGVCQEEKEDYKNCPKDNCELPPKEECTFHSDCKEKPDNPCTENRCQSGKCKVENIEKRIGKQYCFNGNLEDQRGEGSLCDENWECESNLCSNSKCMNISEKVGFFEGIIKAILPSFIYDKLKKWGIL